MCWVCFKPLAACPRPVRAALRFRPLFWPLIVFGLIFAEKCLSDDIWPTVNFFYLSHIRWISFFIKCLVAGCHSFCLFFIFYNIHTIIQSHSYKTFIRRHWPGPLSISSSLVSSVGKSSQWCRAENRTRACLAASRRATNWATPHHN